jgi:hypothetical protein
MNTHAKPDPDLEPGGCHLLGQTFFSGSHKALVVEVSETSGRCYVIAEEVSTGQRWPITVSLVRKLIDDAKERSET